MTLYNRINRKELKQKMKASDEIRITLSFYKYHTLINPQIFRDHLYGFLNQYDVLGRIYVAQEGINAQISVPERNWPDFQKNLGNEIIFLKGIRFNVALDDDGKSFFLLKIKVRDKIVADGLNDSHFDITKRGQQLSAADVNVKVDQEGARFVDMRNHYEWEVGHFKNALLPDVENFRTALPQVEKELADQKGQPIIMYCTGGIRCEKASAYYLHKGFKEVYMIDGGIIEYSRQCEQEGLENKFIGKNFVFDERLGEQISEEVVAHCHQCGKSCDMHTNCANDACHSLIIQCEECASKYEACCSRKCADFNQLPETAQKKWKTKIRFNGTSSGKGRYNSLNKDKPLILSEESLESTA